MEKYYRVNEVKELIKKLTKEPAYQHGGEDFYAGVYTVEDALTDLEEVELEEPKQAIMGLHLGHQYYCSNCGELTYMHNYCASCGAKVIKE